MQGSRGRVKICGITRVLTKTTIHFSGPSSVELLILARGCNFVMFWEKPGVLKNYQTKATTIFFRVRRTLQGNRQPRAKNKKEDPEGHVVFRVASPKALGSFYGLAPFCDSQIPGH